MNGELRPIIGVLGDRVRVSNSPYTLALGTAELQLFVDSHGNIKALTPEQLRQHHSLYGIASSQGEPGPQPQPPGPTGPHGSPYPMPAGLNGPGPPQPSPYEQPTLEGLEYQQT